MVVVAWPVSRPGSGNRAFLLDSRGIVYECLDGPYSGDNAPPPDVVNSQRGNLASRLHAPKGKARDGFSWTLLRE